MQGEYRHLYDRGAYQITGYATYGRRVGVSALDTENNSQKDFRGYLDATGKLQLSPEWSIDGSIRMASDRTFLRRYDINYDDRLRSTALVKTLEEFLRRRGNISATAEALYVHPNTLRQRLRRIGELSGLDLRKDDWLMVEIALKMVKLQEALGTAGTDISGGKRL